MDRRQVPLDRRPPICRARPLGQTVIEPPKPEFRNVEETVAPETNPTPKPPKTKQAKAPKQVEAPTPETIKVLT